MSAILWGLLFCEVCLWFVIIWGASLFIVQQSKVLKHQKKKNYTGLCSQRCQGGKKNIKNTKNIKKYHDNGEYARAVVCDLLVLVVVCRSLACLFECVKKKYLFVGRVCL